MMLSILELFQITTPEEGGVLYWALGILASALGAALIYVKQQHKAQIDAKNLVIENQEKTILYERTEKEKAQEDYKSLVKEFNSIFQQQSLINTAKRG